MDKNELEKLKQSEGYYFGCIGRPGHYVFKKNGAKIYNRFSNWISSMDGKLTPQFGSTEGAALLHHFDGFTILAFHDYSIDKRPGSNSMFIFPGELNFFQMIKYANNKFGQIMERFGFVIKDELQTPPVITGRGGGGMSYF